MGKQNQNAVQNKTPQRSKPQRLVPSGETGALLKKTREEQSLSLQDVSDYLNIRRGLLKAIEDGNYEELPATAYTLGFMRSYAQYVGLDPQAITEQFKQETGEDPQATDFDIPVPIESGHIPNAIVIGLSVLLLLVILGFVIWLAGSNEKDRVARKDIPAVDEVFDGQTIEKSEEYRYAVEADLGAEKSITSPLSSSSQENPMINSRSQNENDPQKQASSSIENESQAILGAERSRVYGAANVDSRIEIRATQNSWLEVKDADGKVLISRVLKPGDVYQVPTLLKTYLTTGNAGGLEVYRDGKSLGPAGKSGTVLRRHEITLDGLKEPL